MIRRTIAASVSLRYLMLAAAVALLAFGVRAIGRMPVDVFPEFAPPTVEVQTEAAGLSAEEVESLITLGLEELLGGVPWLESTRSRSVTGLSTITLIFKPDTDIIKARQMVQERLTLEYKLPNVASPPVILQPVSATSRFMMIGISSDTIEPTELSLLARWTIKPRLVGVPGVANVAIWGQRLRQLHVQIHPERLRNARLTQDEIIAAAGDALWVSPLTFLKASASGSGGWIDNHNQRLGVEHAMPITTPEDLAKLPVVAEPELRFGRNVPLGDVAELTFSHPPLIGDAFANGKDGLLLVLEKFPSAGVPDVTRGVQAALDELAPGLPGVTIDTSIFRLASYIEDASVNLAAALGAGAVLVVLVTGLLRRSWRSALVVITASALSMTAALIVLHQTGGTLNAMVLAGLVAALALVIDQVTADLEPAGDTATVTVYVVSIAALSAVPILGMGGVAGAFLQPFAWAYVLAGLASLVVALTVTPALSAILGEPRRSAGGSPILTTLSARGAQWLRRTVAAPRGVYVALAILAVGGAAVWLFMGRALLPPLRERAIVVTANTAPGTSHEETQRITARISRELRTVPGVTSVGAHVGRAVTGDQIVGVNSSQIWVGVDPRAGYARTLASVRDVIDGYPGIERGVHAYLQDRVSRLLTGDGHAIVVRVYGPNREVRRQKAEDVRRAMADITGLVDLHVESEVEEPQVQVKVNLDKAGKEDLKPGDVRRASATVFSGIVVGYLFKEQKIFEVVVWSSPEARRSLANVGDVWIDRSDRTRVRLRDVADVNIRSTPTVIRHERITPYIDVVANVDGRGLGTVARDVQDRLTRVTFPIEHRAELLGESVERDQMRQRTAGVIVAALAGIFLLLQAYLRSWGLALVSAVVVAGSIAAGLLGALAAGAANSTVSMLGILAVLAIAARNAMLIIQQCRQLEEGRMAAGADLVVRAAAERLPSIVTSTAVIAAALVPMVVFGQVAGLEIARSIAMVIITGAVASAVISLLVIPPLYLLVRPKSHIAPDLGLGDA